jgi:hypothetical protein
MAHFVRDIVVRWQRLFFSALTDAGFARAVPSLERHVVGFSSYPIRTTLKQGLGMVAILVGTFAVVPPK